MTTSIGFVIRFRRSLAAPAHVGRGAGCKNPAVRARRSGRGCAARRAGSPSVPRSRAIAPALHAPRRSGLRARAPWPGPRASTPATRPCPSLPPQFRPPCAPAPPPARARLPGRAGAPPRRRPAVRLDDRLHPLEVTGEERPQRLRVRLLSELGRAGQVAEQGRHRLADLARRVRRADWSAAAVAEAGGLRVCLPAARAVEHELMLKR